MYKDFVCFVRDLYNTNDFISLHEPRFISNEKKYVMDTIDSTFVSSIGAYVTKLEEKVAEYMGVSYAIATVNGTAALHTALLLADVKHDDEVITQSMTFVATCNAIHYCGAEPIFIDVELQTLGMSPEKLEDFLEENAEILDEGCCRNKKTGKTIKACVPMHTFGHPVRIDEIKRICDKFCIQLIEDAAESLGSTYKRKHTGLFGKIAAVSFNGNKVITTGGGGMIVTNDAELANRARHITTTAKKDNVKSFEHDEIGYNYRMPNINAALGCAQMEQIDNYVSNKRQLSGQYSDWCKRNDFKFVTEPENARSNYWLNSIILDTRKDLDNFITYTNDHRVMTRSIWTPMHNLPMFRHCQRDDLKTTVWLADRLVSIPSSVRTDGL